VTLIYRSFRLSKESVVKFKLISLLVSLMTTASPSVPSAQAAPASKEKNGEPVELVINLNALTFI